MDVRCEMEDRDEDELQSQDLCGYCAIASARLSQVFISHRIEHTIHMRNSEGECHVYLVVEDHVVDVTATQFSEFDDQKVVILHTKEAEQYEFYGSDAEFNTAAELRKHQIKTGWPMGQVADPL